MTRTSFWQGLLLTAATLGTIVSANAQSASNAPATNPSAKTDGIEEVVVTATRRAEPLSKVAMSISAFTKQRMDQLDVKSFAQIARFTPGVQFDQTNNQISIRGVSSSAGAATTGVYIDDTPIQMRRLGFGSVNSLPGVFDLDRVEVLRGPQGTLFGAGSEGGAVRYITPQPSLDTYSIYAKSEISQTEHGGASYEGGVAVGGPIIPGQLGFRVSGWMRHGGGWIDHVNYLTGKNIQSNSNYNDTYQVHAALAWQPISNLRVTPSVFLQNRIDNNDGEYWVGLSNPSKGVFKNATPERMANHDFFVLPSLKIDLTLHNVELISNTSYFYRHDLVNGYSGTLYNLSYFQSVEAFGQDPNGNTCPGGLCATNPQMLLLPNTINLPGFGPYLSVNRDTNDQSSITQEVRLQSIDPHARLTWVAGLFYSSERQVSIEEINDPQLPQLTQYLWGEDMLTAWGENLLANGDDYINNNTGHTSQTAFYAHATYRITSKLKLQAGLRVAQTHFDYVNWSDGPQNFGYVPPNTGKKDETPVTPMGGITYQFNPDDMVYATVAKGYRIGGANPPFPLSACQADLTLRGIKTIPSTYNSDSVMSYEAGSKDVVMHHT
ncbi:MAG: TonB-dependent receptor, partial [Alphaproteobacteria bacterium]|nr:TonB-dependent receptor [Alphaproteobacteria bacterium]